MPRQIAPGFRLPVFTSLPASPVDGQEVIYRFAQTVLPADPQVLLWRLRYDAAVGKWLPVGAQEPVFAYDATSRAQSFGAGPSQFSAQIVQAFVPLLGIYRMEIGAHQALCSSGTDNVFLLVSDGSTWVTVGSIGTGTPTTWSTMNGGQARRTIVAGGSAIWGCQPGSTTQTINAAGRYLRLFPVQIG